MLSPSKYFSKVADGDVVPTFGSSAGSLQPVWFSACSLHSFACFYKDLLERLRKWIICVRPNIADKWMPYNDNALCHTVLSVTGFFTSEGIHVVPQPPTHLTPVPVTFLFFLDLKDVISELYKTSKRVLPIC